jgi:hypothetical protein
MTKDEALRLALEVIEDLCSEYNAAQQAINAIKQALEQPEPEPVAFVHIKDGCLVGSHKKENAAFPDGQYALWPINTTPPKREPMDWQPIETAPKDGNKIILYYQNRHNFGRTVMGCWVTDEQANETDTDGVGLEAGWYEQIDNWDDYAQIAIHEGEPTHWMPLPKPPIAHGIGEKNG